MASEKWGHFLVFLVFGGGSSGRGWEPAQKTNFAEFLASQCTKRYGSPNNVIAAVIKSEEVVLGARDNWRFQSVESFWIWADNLRSSLICHITLQLHPCSCEVSSQAIHHPDLYFVRFSTSYVNAFPFFFLFLSFLWITENQNKNMVLSFLKALSLVGLRCLANQELFSSFFTLLRS